MTTQFDALSQLFDQITERLIRIETKLDSKADLSVVAGLEVRLRDTEITVAKKDEVIRDLVPRVAINSENLRSLHEKVASDTKVRDEVHRSASWRLDTWKKKTAIGAAVASLAFTTGEAVWRVVQG